MSSNPNIRFEDWETRLEQDAEFQAAWDSYEPAYQIARLRLRRGLTQAQLAEMVGTTQSSIARLESGRSEPRLSFLRRVVQALDGQLSVHIAATEDATAGARTEPVGPATSVIAPVRSTAVYGADLPAFVYVSRESGACEEVVRVPRHGAPASYSLYSIATPGMPVQTHTVQ